FCLTTAQVRSLFLLCKSHWITVLRSFVSHSTNLVSPCSQKVPAPRLLTSIDIHIKVQIFVSFQDDLQISSRYTLCLNICRCNWAAKTEHNLDSLHHIRQV